jgi:4-amino-4-deoxy-L-arabinose transferase-like glycosyltransferase
LRISKDRFYSIIGPLLVVVSVLAVNPVLEMGTNDDWSYAWLARELAATGRFTYNGWIGAMIGVQAEWAAMLIRWFGFSFTLVRLSTLPFAAGCAFLLYRLSRSAGLNPECALFATLSVALSPEFIPLAASFMTDVPAFFFWLAGIYCAVRAAEADSRWGACVWMAAGCGAGIVGGTNRQVVWFVPLMVLPAVAWMRRRDRGVIAWSSVLWCGSAVATWLFVRWFNAQPGSVLPPPDEPQSGLEMVEGSIETFFQIAVGCLLLVLPALALHLTAWRQWVRKPIRLMAGLGTAGALLAGLFLFGDDLLLGNIITPFGMLSQGLEMLGTKPEVLGEPVRFVLGAALVGCLGVTLAVPWRSWMRGERMRRLVWIYGAPCVVYVGAVTYRSVRDWLLFDRYLILLLPLILIPLLGRFQERVREMPPAWSWVAVGMLAAFGVGLTHDYLAACRARLEAAGEVVAAGIPRTQVSAGLEYDGWTQLERAGRLPSPAEQKAAGPRRYPVSPPYWYWQKTPVVDPVYVVTYSPLGGLEESGFAPIEFRAWLPPFRRRVLVQKAAK